MIARLYGQLVQRLNNIAKNPAVSLESIGEFVGGERFYPMFMVQMGTSGTLRVLIAAGIHGDEPAGVEAGLHFMETTATDKDLLSRFHFTIFPCNNPTG